VSNNFLHGSKLGSRLIFTVLHCKMPEMAPWRWWFCPPFDRISSQAMRPTHASGSTAIASDLPDLPRHDTIR